MPALATLLSSGDGTFTDVTFKAGITTQGASHTVDFADVNKDGWLDIFVGNEDSDCELWMNQGGDDRFINVANKDVRACGLVKAMVFTDHDNNLSPDIFLSRYGASNVVLQNGGRWSKSEPGKWLFSDVTRSLGLSDPLFSFPIASFDADQDGTLDMLVAGHLFEGPDAICASYTNETYFVDTLHDDAQRPAFGTDATDKRTKLFLNRNPGGAYSEVPATGGLARHVMSMSVNYGDLDNDGHLDLYFGTGQPEPRAIQPNRMYRNAGDGLHWQDVTTSGNFGHLQKGHGISFADIDNDGDLDIYSQVSEQRE